MSSPGSSVRRAPGASHCRRFLRAVLAFVPAAIALSLSAAAEGGHSGPMHLLFNSDRTGSSHLYAVNSDGGDLADLGPAAALLSPNGRFAILAAPGAIVRVGSARCARIASVRGVRLEDDRIGGVVARRRRDDRGEERALHQPR